MANSQTPIDFSQLNLPHSPIPGAPGPTGNQAQVIDPNASVKQVDEALKQLSDIVLPADISIWPPAPGWWILAAILLILLYYLSKFVYFRIKRFKKIRQIKKQIRTEIDLVNMQWQENQNIINTSAQLSTLFKRYILFIIENKKFNKGQTELNKRDIASISHLELLRIVEQHFKIDNFSEQYKDIFTDLIYQDPELVLDMDEKKNLTELINQFIPLLRKLTFKALKSISTAQLLTLDDVNYEANHV